MMQRQVFVIVFCLLGLTFIVFAGPHTPSSGPSPEAGARFPVAPAQRFWLDINQPEKRDTSAPAAAPAVNAHEMTPRRVNALVLSVVVPGAGQTMLGDTYKGLGFTLAYFGSALTALISHNNFIARGERLDALEYQYSSSTNWTSSDVIYGQMKESYQQWKDDRRRRNIFIAVSAAIWIANIADLLYNTEDSGEKVFSHSVLKNGGYPQSPWPRGFAEAQLLSISIPLGK